jgi:hypothetical protein
VNVECAKFVEKSLYELGLHEICPVETIDRELWTSVMRVPGGWIYRSFDKGNKMMCSAFVPYDNGFAGVMPEDPK